MALSCVKCRICLLLLYITQLLDVNSVHFSTAQFQVIRKWCSSFWMLGLVLTGVICMKQDLYTMQSRYISISTCIMYVLEYMLAYKYIYIICIICIIHILYVLFKW